MDVLRALHLDDFAAGQALAEQAGERVHRVQGRDQNILSLGRIVVRESGSRNGFSDAALPAGEDVAHLRSLFEELGEGRHGKPP